MTERSTGDSGRPTVRDLLERYEENKQDTDPATAMIQACDELLDEMDRSLHTGSDRS